MASSLNTTLCRKPSNHPFNFPCEADSWPPPPHPHSSLPFVWFFDFLTFQYLFKVLYCETSFLQTGQKKSFLQTDQWTLLILIFTLFFRPVLIWAMTRIRGVLGGNIFQLNFLWSLHPNLECHSWTCEQYCPLVYDWKRQLYWVSCWTLKCHHQHSQQHVLYIHNCTVSLTFVWWFLWAWKFWGYG